MRYFAGLLLAVAISGGLVVPAAAGPAPVSMEIVSGLVLVKLFPHYRVRFGRNGMPLFYGSRLLLRRGAKVILIYADGTRVMLTADGSFTIGPPSSYGQTVASTPLPPLPPQPDASQ
jgi:hypothetical protein